MIDPLSANNGIYRESISLNRKERLLFPKISRQNVSWFLSWHKNTRRGFILKPAERIQVSLKNGNMDFQNSCPFKRQAYFLVKITEDFERSQYFNFLTDFLKNKNFFKKKSGTVFCLKIKHWKCNIYVQNCLVKIQCYENQEQSRLLYFFKNLISVRKFLIRNWFKVPTTQMSNSYFNPLMHNVPKWSDKL